MADGYVWIWRSVGMILTGEHRNTWRKPCFRATLFATNPTWSGQGARGSAATDRLSCSTPGMHGNDPLVRGFGHRTSRKRYNMALLRHRWNKSS